MLGVDQRAAPGDDRSQNVWWAHLGEFRVGEGTLTVELFARTDGIVLADGVRLERVGN
jgi:hypothetical protein